MRYPYLWFAVLFIGATVHIAEDFTPAQKNFWSFRPGYDLAAWPKTIRCGLR